LFDVKDSNVLDRLEARHESPTSCSHCRRKPSVFSEGKRDLAIGLFKSRIESNKYRTTGEFARRAAAGSEWRIGQAAAEFLELFSGKAGSGLLVRALCPSCRVSTAANFWKKIPENRTGKPTRAKHEVS
jgi:hypothetical protein